MRLWTLHPRYLDPVGLVAAWREGLLAQKVLAGGTRGYTHHPQLQRFRDSPEPMSSIAKYLGEILIEAMERGYSFDPSRIPSSVPGLAVPGLASGRTPKIAVNGGQIRYELELLRWKLERRSPESLTRLPDGGRILVNGAFELRPGPIESWENVIEEVRGRLVGRRER